MYATDLATALRAFHLDVVETTGWKRRGHGALLAVAGIVAHHTAGPRAGNMPSLRVVTSGRPGLSGPLCNIGLARDGSCYVVAAGMAYHAGVGSWRGSPRGNSRFFGIEAESTGRGDWTASQVTAYPRLCAAIVRHYGLDVDNVIGHLEWAPRRKIDPHAYPGGMKALRAKTLAVLEESKAKPSPRPVPKPSRGSKPRARVTKKLVVDGKFGPGTIRALQRELHVTVDGTYGKRTKVALQKRLGVHADGVIGPQTVRALQRVLHVTADGSWGQKTTAALQRRLNAGSL